MGYVKTRIIRGLNFFFKQGLGFRFVRVMNFWLCNWLYISYVLKLWNILLIKCWNWRMGIGGVIVSQIKTKKNFSFRKVAHLEFKHYCDFCVSFHGYCATFWKNIFLSKVWLWNQQQCPFSPFKKKMIKGLTIIRQIFIKKN